MTWGRWTGDVGRGDVGRWALGVGRWTLGVGRWALGVGRWALGVGRWTLEGGGWFDEGTLSAWDVDGLEGNRIDASGGSYTHQALKDRVNRVPSFTSLSTWMSPPRLVIWLCTR